jgi:hypothetical protein
MLKEINHFLDKASAFLAPRKGLLPMIALVFVIANGALQFFPGLGWLVSANCLLHLGIIIAIIGFMLGWAL